MAKRTGTSKRQRKLIKALHMKVESLTSTIDRTKTLLDVCVTELQAQEELAEQFREERDEAHFEIKHVHS